MKYIESGHHQFSVGANERLHLTIWQHETSKEPLSCQVDLNGPKASARVYYCFTGAKDDELQGHVTINHQSPDTKAQVVVKGILRDQARHRFTSLISVAKDATRTESFLEHRTLLLSDRATVETTPALEILTDDVKASHAATVSHFDQEQLAYAQSRGLTLPVTEELLTQSFLADVLDNFAKNRRLAIMKKLS